MTLSEIMRTTDKKEWPHEFLRWKNEDQIQQEDRIERAKKRGRAKERREFAKLKLKAEETEKKAKQDVAKAIKMERVIELMSQGMCKEEAFKQVEQMEE